MLALVDLPWRISHAFGNGLVEAAAVVRLSHWGDLDAVEVDVRPRTGLAGRVPAFEHLEFSWRTKITNGDVCLAALGLEDITQFGPAPAVTEQIQQRVLDLGDGIQAPFPHLTQRRRTEVKPHAIGDQPPHVRRTYPPFHAHPFTGLEGTLQRGVKVFAVVGFGGRIQNESGIRLAIERLLTTENILGNTRSRAGGAGIEMVRRTRVALAPPLQRFQLGLRVVVRAPLHVLEAPV